MREILELGNLINEVMNTLESIENRAHQMEERISTLGDRNLEMTQKKRELIFFKLRNPKELLFCQTNIRKMAYRREKGTEFI